MSATVHYPARNWARAHAAALAIVFLSIALAAAVALLAARVAAGSPTAPARPVPGASVPAGQLQTVSDSCNEVRPGQPC